MSVRIQSVGERYNRYCEFCQVRELVPWRFARWLGVADQEIWQDASSSKRSATAERLGFEVSRAGLQICRTFLHTFPSHWSLGSFSEFQCPEQCPETAE